jgi:hypothetical protein
LHLVQYSDAAVDIINLIFVDQLIARHLVRPRNSAICCWHPQPKPSEQKYRTRAEMPAFYWK